MTGVLAMWLMLCLPMFFWPGCPCCDDPCDDDCGEFSRTAFFDSFTDTDGTAISSHSPDTDLIGSGWVNGPFGPTTMEVRNNKAQGVSTGLCSALMECGQPNGILSATFTIHSDQSGIMWRYTDSPSVNFWRARFIPSASSDLRLSVEKVVNGSSSTESSTVVGTTGVGQTKDLKIELCGSSIEVSVDDSLEFQTNDPHSCDALQGILLLSHFNQRDTADDFRFEDDN